MSFYLKLYIKPKNYVKLYIYIFFAQNYTLAKFSNFSNQETF